MSEFDNKEIKASRKPLFRQLLVCSGVCSSYFTYGLVTGAPTVFIPQIRAEHNSTDIISGDMASWLSSVVSFSGFPCVLILTIISRCFGRKITFMIACIDALIAFLLFFFSATVFQVLISQIIQGLLAAAQIVVSILILTEYTSPKYRGLFLTVKCATLYWGIWVANVLGTFFHWKKIGIVGILCSTYSVITVFIWPESPYWLASKGRYEECTESHRWLKGCDPTSEKELEDLINTQKEYARVSAKSNLSPKETVRGFLYTIKAKEFYKPTIISLMSILLYLVTGKTVCVVYAIDILKKITGSDSTAYTGMLILDGITVISMYLGCVLSRYLKRRVLLLGASSAGVLFLAILSLYFYLIRLSTIIENKYISLFLLTLFSVAVSCGPLIMSVAIYAELVPVRSRNLAICIIALSGKLFLGISVKFAPLLFKTLDLHGAFLFFALASSVVIMILYKYLPETKDKTLQEIADSLVGVTRIRNQNLEESSTLVHSKK